MRKVVPLVLVIALVGALAAVKAKQFRLLTSAGRAAAAAGPRPEAVAIAVASQETWQTVVTAVGSVEAEKGVTVSSEAAGVVTKLRFDSGDAVKASDILVELDASVERAQLASAIARKSLAAQTLERNKALVARGVIAGVQLEADQAALSTAAADVAALQAQIGKKVVRAPFTGKLGIRLVNVGQFLNPGTAIAVLQGAQQADNATFVDFTLPQQRLSDVAVGSKVQLTGSVLDGMLEGTVTAISPTVELLTRSIKVRATAKDPKNVLRAGMFLNVAVVLPNQHTVIAIPATAVVRAPYGSSVFLVEEQPGPDGTPRKVARQQFVRLGEARGDFVAVEQGIAAGATVVTAGAFKLRNNSPIVIKDDVAPKPDLAPKPENR